MQNVERIIGRLEEFQDWTKDEFKAIKHQQNIILSEIKGLNKIGWVMYGKLAVLNSIMVILIELALHNFL